MLSPMYGKPTFPGGRLVKLGLYKRARIGRETRIMKMVKAMRKNNSIFGFGRSFTKGSNFSEA